MTPRPPLLIVSSTIYAIDRFLLKSIDLLSLHFSIVILTNSAVPSLDLPSGRAIKIVCIPIRRKISIFNDLRALLEIYLLGFYYSPVLTISLTPKGGLLASVASIFHVSTPHIHIFTGQVWHTRSGFSRRLLKFFDYIIGLSSNSLLADSPSQIEFLVQEGVVPPEKITLIGNGSLGGVDLSKFVPNPSLKSQFRVDYNLDNSTPVILFMARLTVDKGALLAAESFVDYRLSGGLGVLLFVGPDEDSLLGKINTILCDFKSDFIYFPYTSSPENFFPVADIFFMPSFREGFGSVYLLAAACGIPSIGSLIYGTSDAVLNNETGLLVSPGDVKGFSRALLDLERNCALREGLGAKARSRVLNSFSDIDFANKFLEYFLGIASKSHRETSL